MWYNEKRPAPVKAPRKKEKWSLRIMLLIGFCSMGFFLYAILQPQHKGYAPLYYLLIFSILFLCFKIAYEWYHYFDISVPAKKPLSKKYKVDVLTTFVPGEPYEMVIETLEAIQKISYPHTTYLCDEGNDPYLIEQCKRLGVVHVYREKKINAKAGNINNALYNYATGDIALIFDPDHVPAPEFLDEVLPYFEDPKVGFVQAVQGYYNIGENIIAKASAQQTFQFYGPIMMTMNSYGTAQAIGANCCFRRAALDSIGGHAPGLAEDMNTSMKLHAQGWKSVYVPKVLNRGLVPSTISAYYKQQLKWSRGVFELLVTTYLQNFWKFTWRQKLHYGLLPWHYFSGVVYFLNFIIPIFALLLGLMPMTINIAYFFLVGLPFFASIIIIRHFVQRWVMEEDERGLHLVGGILLIGAWWIHMLGFLFTLLRRKVPYNPTPKDGKEENILAQNLPNIGIGLLSIAAIAYGLNLDFNPYSMAMAGFALINVGFMALMVLISYQNTYRQYKKTHPFADKLAITIWQGKRLFWLFRHSMYGYIRLLALPIIVILVLGLFYYAFNTNLEDIEAAPPPPSKNAHYLGLYTPGVNNSFSDFNKIDSLSEALGIKPSIITTYLAWGPDAAESFPKDYFRQVYQRQAYPMINWEPWLSDFPQYDSTQSFMTQIHAGLYDSFLHKMAQHFKELGKPVFLRFAHEPDNPYYGWHNPGKNAAAEYILAWRYVHHFMVEAGVDNLIWVFNPWRYQEAVRYYPGDAYVDWLGVTALNYASTVAPDNWQSFHDIYAPFSRSLAFQRNKPVMLAEFGTLQGRKSTDEWYQLALKNINQNFPEIEAVVLFASARDAILPQGGPGKPLNWLSNADKFNHFAGYQQNIPPPTTVPRLNAKPDLLAENISYRNLQGVNYMKSIDWHTSMHPLFRQVVQNDFANMGKLQLNWIKRYGPGVYDRNVLRGAENQNINVMYALWVENHLDFDKDQGILEDYAKSILETVEDNKDQNQIKAWHLGNPIWHALADYNSKPELYYQRQTYLKWLQKLAANIKELDPTRPLSIELKQDPYLPNIVSEIARQVPALDGLGIIMNPGPLDSTDLALLDSLALPVFISRMDAQPPQLLASIKTGWFLDSWQDDVYHDYVSFKGLIDHEGRKKLSYQKVLHRLGSDTSPNLPEVRILRPADIPFPGRVLEYDALIRNNSSWQYAKVNPDSLRFDWYLVKTDDYGNALAMEKVGTGKQAYIKMPPQPFRYKIYLLAHKKGYATSHISDLTTPVYWGPKLEELSAEQIDYLLMEDLAREF